ncbi:MAG: hypothetical protein ACYCRH_03190 [Acidiferrobacteraceae bacterium]
MAPSNLTLQYHFLPAEKFSPHLGAGINYRMSRKYFISVDLAKWYIKVNLTPQGGSMIETMQLNPVTLGVSLGRYFRGHALI